MFSFSKLYGFKEEKEVDYNGEHYSVRDNGAVKRHSKEGQKARRYDNLWTYGNPSRDGYLYIGSERIHRIVATAFLGSAPTPEHIVDHLDTNKANNRPENLCWKTREENILTNELTKRKIEFRTGLPIEKVMEDLSILHKLEPRKNHDWMTPVSEEESKHSIAKWKNWMDFQDKEKSLICPEKIKASFVGFFLCQPVKYSSNILVEYFNNLTPNAIIYDSKQFTIRVIQAEMTEDHSSIIVKCHSSYSVKEWIIYKITYTGHKIEHFYRTCFASESMEKYYAEALGRDWLGDDVVDDFCYHYEWRPCSNSKILKQFPLP